MSGAGRVGVIGGGLLSAVRGVGVELGEVKLRAKVFVEGFSSHRELLHLRSEGEDQGKGPHSNEGEQHGKGHISIEGED